MSTNTTIQWTTFASNASSTSAASTSLSTTINLSPDSPSTTSPTTGYTSTLSPSTETLSPPVSSSNTSNSSRTDTATVIVPIPPHSTSRTQTHPSSSSRQSSSTIATATNSTSSIIIINPPSTTKSATPSVLPPFDGDDAKHAGSPPILMIIAVAISVGVFLLLVAILTHQCMVRRRQWWSEHRQSLHLQHDSAVGGDEGGGSGSGRGIGPASSSSNSSISISSPSIANTYQSMSRGQVRVVIDRPGDAATLGGRSAGGADDGAGGGSAGSWMERLWPVPPGHPAHRHYYYGYEHDYDDAGIAGSASGENASEKRRGEIRRREWEPDEQRRSDDEGSDPNQWSAESQDGSGGVSERAMAVARSTPPITTTIVPRRVGTGTTSGTGSGRSRTGGEGYRP